MNRIAEDWQKTRIWAGSRQVILTRFSVSVRLIAWLFLLHYAYGKTTAFTDVLPRSLTDAGYVLSVQVASSVGLFHIIAWFVIVLSLHVVLKELERWLRSLTVLP